MEPVRFPAPNQPKGHSVREIEFKTRTSYTTKVMLDALCWASIRRGNNAWKAENVTQTVREYLLDHGGHPDTYPYERINRVMRYLDENGYAELVTNGRRYTKFAFHPDVDLRRPTPDFVGKKSTVSSEDIQLGDVVIVTDDSGLPVPSIKPERYLAMDINKLMDRFADIKPEAYGNYAEKLVAGLRAVLGE